MSNRNKNAKVVASENKWRFGNSQFLHVYSAHPHLIWIIEKNGTLKLLSPVDVNSYLWIYQDRFKNWVLKLILGLVLMMKNRFCFPYWDKSIIQYTRSRRVRLTMRVFWDLRLSVKVLFYCFKRPKWVKYDPKSPKIINWTSNLRVWGLF